MDGKQGIAMRMKANRIKDFINKEIYAAGKAGAVIGVSGGIDSAVCLALCAQVLDSVTSVFLPHREEHFKIRETVEKMSRSRNADFQMFDLTPSVGQFAALTRCGDPMLLGNFTARLRTAYLYHMAALNNSLVINTGNRTEILTGYCTKWGDQAGDISPLGDMYKTEVRQMAAALGVPSEILNAPPSAGFFAGQTDELELGISYEELDEALMRYDSGIELSTDSENDALVLNLINRSEHKRKFPATPGRASEEKTR